MNSVQLTIAAYVVYLVLSIGITIWVAKTLFKNGKIFLYDIFHGNQALAESVNNLLLVGFYLVNVGYAVYVLKVTDSITNAQQLLEILSVKVGFIILLLGGMHFFNLFVFFRLRRKAQLHTQAVTQATIINQR